MTTKLFDVERFNFAESWLSAAQGYGGSLRKCITTWAKCGIEVHKNQHDIAKYKVACFSSEAVRNNYQRWPLFRLHNTTGDLIAIEYSGELFIRYSSEDTAQMQLAFVAG